jgi:hypothetical protein
MKHHFTKRLLEREWIARAGGLLLLLPQLAAAQTAPIPIDFFAVACEVFNWLYTFALVTGMVFIVIAAFKYMTGGGDPSKVGEAHRALLYAVVGIAVALIAAAVPSVVASLFDAKVTACP